MDPCYFINIWFQPETNSVSVLPSDLKKLKIIKDLCFTFLGIQYLKFFWVWLGYEILITMIMLELGEKLFVMINFDLVSTSLG